MWICKLQWRHDCTVGNRCREFNVRSISLPLDIYTEKGYNYYTHFDVLYGKEESIKGFIQSLKDDKDVINVEVSRHSVFFVVRIPVKRKIPTPYYDKRVFNIRPLVVDENGDEHWEIASWKKEHINAFIEHIKKTIKGLEYFKVLKIVEQKIDAVYFPESLPDLTKKQLQSLDIASKNGYYGYPRKAELDEMAKIAGVSLSTFREHLRIAEAKVIPTIIKNIKSYEE